MFKAVNVPTLGYDVCCVADTQDHVGRNYRFQKLLTGMAKFRVQIVMAEITVGPPWQAVHQIQMI